MSCYLGMWKYCRKQCHQLKMVTPGNEENEVKQYLFFSSLYPFGTIAFSKNITLIKKI
jgi:hypothetical protein